MNEHERKAAISQHMAEMGRRGGSVVSARKKKALKESLKKANAARLKRGV